MWHRIIRNATLFFFGRLYEHVIISYRNNFLKFTMLKPKMAKFQQKFFYSSLKKNKSAHTLKSLKTNVSRINELH